LPRNVDPAVNEQLNVFVHDIEALKRVVSSNLSRRRREVPRVEAMIEEEIERLSQWRQVLRVGPLIAALKKAVEEARLREVSKASSGLSEAEVEAVERATRAVTNKLLHGPVTAIKHYAQQADEGADALALVRSVFGHLLTDEDDE
jgi:glutamyl-tRNA reductase